jgi:hypothetical protein
MVASEWFLGKYKSCARCGIVQGKRGNPSKEEMRPIQEELEQGQADYFKNDENATICAYNAPEGPGVPKKLVHAKCYPPTSISEVKRR